MVKVHEHTVVQFCDLDKLHRLRCIVMVILSHAVFAAPLTAILAIARATCSTPLVQAVQPNRAPPACATPVSGA